MGSAAGARAGRGGAERRREGVKWGGGGRQGEETSEWSGLWLWSMRLVVDPFVFLFCVRGVAVVFRHDRNRGRPFVLFTSYVLLCTLNAIFAASILHYNEHYCTKIRQTVITSRMCVRATKCVWGHKYA